MTDEETIRLVLERDEQNELEDKRTLHSGERKAFRDMLARAKPLSDKQRAWVYGAGNRLGLALVAPAANVFSSLAPKVQEKERERAAAVVLPWEAPGYKKPLRPPRARSED